MALTDKLKSIADAIRGKTGKSDGLTLDQMPGEIEGIETGGGEEVYFSSTGNMYTRNTVIPVPQDGAFYAQSHFFKAVNMESIICNAPVGAFSNFSTFLYFCTSLKSAKFPMLSGTLQASNTKNMFQGCTALETAEIGSVGNSVLQIAANAFSGCTQKGLTITIYTDGETLADITTNLTNYAPWGATNATIVYRNSTTGEVITE